MGGRIRRIKASFNQRKLNDMKKREGSNKNGRHKVQTKVMYKSLKTTGNKTQKHMRKHWRRYRRRHRWETQDGIMGENRTNWQRHEGEQRLYTHTNEGMRNRWTEVRKRQVREGMEKHWKEGKTHRGRNWKAWCYTRGHNFTIKQERTQKPGSWNEKPYLKSLLCKQMHFN